MPRVRDMGSEEPERNRVPMTEVSSHLAAEKPMPGLHESAWIESARLRLVELADANTVPGEFTASVGYEDTRCPRARTSAM